VIGKDLFEDVPIPRRFDAHQAAPREGIERVGMLSVRRLYHVLPLPSSPHRPSPGYVQRPRKPCDHGDVRESAK
jgi:hypothetical protein